MLRAVLNLAVECEALDKNRLRRLPVPQYVKRERVAESWELQKIQKTASQKVWRVVILALQTGMRESKLIDIHEEWLVQRGDGLWLAPSPGRSTNKRVAKAIPINDLARAALRWDLPRLGGRFFWRWKDANSIKHRWLDTIERAGVHELHFHDLRIRLQRGCLKLDWIISSSKNFSAIDFPELVTYTFMIGIHDYVMRSLGLLS